MRLYLKLMLGSIAILLAVLSLLFLMNYMKFQNILSEVVSSRLQVIVATIGRSLSHANALGLKLTEMNDATVLLERAKALDTGIADISVTDTNGRILYSTQPALIGSVIEGHDRNPTGDKAPDSWYREGSDVLTSGLTLRNAVDRPLGSVVLVYSKAGYNAVIHGVAGALLLGSAAIFAFFSVAMMLAARFACRELTCIYGLFGAQVSAAQGAGAAPRQSPLNLPPDTRRWVEGIGEDVHRIERIKQSVDAEMERVLSQLEAEGRPREGCRR